jgi:uncharacterized protein (DUF1330 family)
MTVYIINNLMIRDRDEYLGYVRRFVPVFQKYGGTVLAAQDAPEPVEGCWPYDRTVLLSFPSREAAERWTRSPEYLDITRKRRSSTVSNIIILDALPR